MITRENRVIAGRRIARRCRPAYAAAIPQPEYITLYQIWKMYIAFRFYRTKCYRSGIHKKCDFWYVIKGLDGQDHGRFCINFGEWIDLHTKQSRMYRIY
jgi:hypothetical protein